MRGLEPVPCECQRNGGGEPGERHRKGPAGPEAIDEADRLDRAEREPAVEVRGADEAAEREQGQMPMLSGTPMPALYSVPEPQPSAICIVRPNRNAPTTG